MKMFVFLLMLAFAAPALADDWQVSRVRGEVSQQVNGAWTAVQRGDTIPNNRYLQTGQDGRVGLSRGAETIELENNTQIRIKDAGAERMTSVIQDFGIVTIEAERRNVQHFSVQTPFLAAVVKGTRFTVRSDKRGATVQVNRGIVQVQDTVNDLVVDVRPGQEATVTKEAPLLVQGAGAVSVFSFKGVPVINGTTTTTEDAARSDADKTNNAGGNGNGKALGLTKTTVDETIGGVTGKSNNAGGNGNGKALGLSNNSGGGNNGSNGKSVGNAVTDAATSAATTVTDTVSGATSALGNSNAGGNGVGKALGLSKD